MSEINGRVVIPQDAPSYLLLFFTLLGDYIGSSVELPAEGSRKIF